MSHSELSTHIAVFELADAIIYFSAMMLFLLLEIFTSVMGYAISGYSVSSNRNVYIQVEILCGGIFCLA